MTDEGKREQHGIPHLVRENLGTTVALGITTLATFRVLAIAGGDAREAAFLATSAGPNALLAAVGTSLFPLVALLAVIIFWFLASEEQRLHRVAFTLPPLGLILCAIVPLYLLVASVVLIAVMLVVVFDRRRQPISIREELKGALTPIKDGKVNRRWLVMVPAVMFVTSTPFVYVISPDPWLAPERITLDPQSRPFTAYVLQDDKDRLVVLRDSSRVIEAHDGKGVKRVFCNPIQDVEWWPNWPSRSLVAIATGTADTGDRPRCPRA